MEQKDTKQAVEARLDAMLESLKAAPLQVTPEAVAALWQPAREAYNAYIAAMDRYDADLQARQAVLDQQGQALDAQIMALEKRIKALEATGREAASRGDLDAAAEADEQAETLRTQKVTARRKCRIASGAELRGDADLFADIREKQAAYTATLDLCGRYVREAVAVVKE